MRNVATPAPVYLRSSWRSTSHIIIIIIKSCDSWLVGVGLRVDLQSSLCLLFWH